MKDHQIKLTLNGWTLGVSLRQIIFAIMLQSILAYTGHFCVVFFLNKKFHFNNDACLILQLVATTALYLAAKVEENHLKIRDVINVAYR